MSMTQQLCHGSLQLLIVLTLSMSLVARCSENVGHFLATKTRYAQRLPIPNAPSIHELPDPAGYHASTMWLLARHGTRWPTMDRMQQMETLAVTFKDASNTDAYPWVKGWVSPMSGMADASGELHPVGEDELWSLAQRLRKRFPSVVRSAYLPRRYPIVSTQVPRAAASASAFAAGFFPGQPYDNSVGPQHQQQKDVLAGLSKAGPSDPRQLREMLASLDHKAGGGGGGDAWVRPQAVAISMSPKSQDPLLRFFEACPAYAQREEWLETWLASWLSDQWAALAPAVGKRLGMKRPMTACEVEALWSLCQVEAGVLGVMGRACAVFSPAELERLEWLDDVNLLESHGWGSPLNYQIAAPLLQDLRSALQAAAGGDAGGNGHGRNSLHARLLFAHCETLVPLATLLGLFKPDLPPTPNQAQVPDKQEVVKVAPAEEARRLLGLVDSVDDLPLHMGRDQADQQQQGHTTVTPVGEGVDVCVGGRVPGSGVPVPQGWFPGTPFNDSRVFRGGRVSPYGANMALVLYKKTNHTAGGRSLYRVRLLYNEQVIPIPLCEPVGVSTPEDPGAHLDCTLDDFLAATASAAQGPDTLQAWCSNQAANAA